MNASQPYAAVSVVLPNSSSARVIDDVLTQPGASVLSWKARGTLLHDHWLKRWVPPISPAKTMLQMLVPQAQSSQVVRRVVETTALHKQATGAVFSTPCETYWSGESFHNWPPADHAYSPIASGLTENLSVIYCIVTGKLSDRVARAAIHSGAHGPIVYYCEGRGLRDRLGWLRITKEHEKEVLMVITEESDADTVFSAMAKAGELHLPGRGFMYRKTIDQGIFNLPSRTSHPHHAANMQQVINAIDHLTGHSHWRDHNVFEVGSDGRGVGLASLSQQHKQLTDQVCLSVVVAQPQTQALMDVLLDAGAPGLNASQARFARSEGTRLDSGARLNEEFSILRCITSPQQAETLSAAVYAQAAQSNACLFTQPVPLVATYVPGSKDYRNAA